MTHPVDNTLAAHAYAMEHLPAALAEMRQAENQLERAQDDLDEARDQVEALLRDIIVKHRQSGKVGITTMANGSLLYWLPDDKE